MSALIFRLFINGLQKRAALVCTRGEKKRGVEDIEKKRALARLPVLHLI